jgi:hypothetical protein
MHWWTREIRIIRLRERWLSDCYALARHRRLGVQGGISVEILTV